MTHADLLARSARSLFGPGWEEGTRVRTQCPRPSASVSGAAILLAEAPGPGPSDAWNLGKGGRSNNRAQSREVRGHGVFREKDLGGWEPGLSRKAAREDFVDHIKPRVAGKL